jgi:hypothetical protein
MFNFHWKRSHPVKLNGFPNYLTVTALYSVILEQKKPIVVLEGRNYVSALLNI